MAFGAAVQTQLSVVQTIFVTNFCFGTVPFLFLVQNNLFFTAFYCSFHILVFVSVVDFSSEKLKK